VYPTLRRTSAAALEFFLALTVGLLVFLLVDTASEGLELARDTGAALDGVELFALGALTVIAVLVALESTIGRRREAQAQADAEAEGQVPAPGTVPGGAGLAVLVAVGIGLHNLGEGLAVGAAVAAGEVAVGTALVLGFAAHNTTEGLAIASPLAGDPRAATVPRFAALVAVAGLPTIVGAWAGAFTFNPAWAALAFGVAAGAIARVVWAVGRGLVTGRQRVSTAVASGFVAGLVVMYLTGLLTA
jgi:ZIP family zinc transporter